MRRNVIQGTSGDDTLIGTPGGDAIFGGAGVDVMSGGAGYDFYYVDNAGDQVIEAVDGGYDAVFTTVSYTLAAGQEIEYLEPRSRRSTDGLVLGGNEFWNWITGTRGNDTLSGGGGDDIVDAGAGDDTLDGGTGDDLLRAQGGADTLNGGDGDDRLWASGLGSCIMAGGAGDDIYYVLNTGSSVSEEAGGGRDTLVTSRSYTLAAGQEIEVLRPHNYIYYSDTDLILTGNELDNYLVGGGGDDTLAGAGGNDRLDGGFGASTMTGGAGDDIYFVRSTADVVNEDAGGGTDTIYTFINYTLAAGLKIETLRVASNSAAGLTLMGNGFDNYIIGGAGNDTLAGAGGDDRLNGGAGGDTMAGGAGNDSYYVDNAGDVVTEAAGGGTDTVFTSVSYDLAVGQEIELLRVFGVTTGLQLRGNERDNILIGGAGDDRLESGAGNDQLYGNDGNDTLITTGASAIIHGGDGDDLIRLDSDTYTSTGEVVGGAGNDTVHSTDLGQFAIRGVETLDTYYGFLTGTVAQIASFDNYTAVLGDLDTRISLSLRGAGGALDFTTGISGQNSVEIRDAGLTSAIRVTGSVNGDLMFGTGFADTFRGGEGDDTLLGGDGNDTLDGGAGDDLLNGGTGNDKLSGGAGNDIFRFDSPIAAGTNIDLVADFTSGSDTLQLDSTNYFQGLTLGQLSAAQFSSGPATGAGPQIVYDQSTGALYYDSDGAGGTGGASRFATVTSKPALTASDFTIV